ncbi:MAG: phosphoenolpyruvate carboxykinase [Bacillota bacterium]
MSNTVISWLPRQIIMSTPGPVCSTPKELLSSHLFREVVRSFVAWLRRKDSPLLAIFEGAGGAGGVGARPSGPGPCPGPDPGSSFGSGSAVGAWAGAWAEAGVEAGTGEREKARAGDEAARGPGIPPGTGGAATDGISQRQEDVLVSLLQALGAFPLEQAARSVPGAASLARNPRLLHEFVEALYDYWRRFNRFIVCYSETGAGAGVGSSTRTGAGMGLDARPYRTFNDTVEQLTHVVRAAYRDICENITGDHPRIYRQVAAGAQVGLIAVPKKWPCPDTYSGLAEIRFIRQVLIDPPLIIDPPMNKRTGEFLRAQENPLERLALRPEEWLCYPAQVGPVVVFVYFHQKFMGLGCSLANLFELATDEQIGRGPDAIYAFGVAPEGMTRFGDLPTVFHEDHADHLLVAAIPGEDRFGYFGYLKKMMLTLHNILVMKRLGRMPFHGAMTRVVLKSGPAASVVIIGDTGTGKSESLEAFRVLGEEYIRELRVVADDMGSLEIAPDGAIRGYGTEIGAFVRLDDLQPGYAFDQVDRAIIMSPHKTNARAVMPVTTMDEVLAGHPVGYILYANNYEEVDEAHPVIERFTDTRAALAVFREGAAMSKGTTTSTGLVRTYFANAFGPPQYRDLHEDLACRTFDAAFKAGLFVGQVRTRLGVPGYELAGPEAAAKALFDLISCCGGH